MDWEWHHFSHNVIGCVKSWSVGAEVHSAQISDFLQTHNLQTSEKLESGVQRAPWTGSLWLSSCIQDFHTSYQMQWSKAHQHYAWPSVPLKGTLTIQFRQFDAPIFGRSVWECPFLSQHDCAPVHEDTHWYYQNPSRQVLKCYFNNIIKI